MQQKLEVVAFGHVLNKSTVSRFKNWGELLKPAKTSPILSTLTTGMQLGCSQTYARVGRLAEGWGWEGDKNAYSMALPVYKDSPNPSDSWLSDLQETKPT